MSWIHLGRFQLVPGSFIALYIFSYSVIDFNMYYNLFFSILYRVQLSECFLYQKVSNYLNSDGEWNGM